MPSFFDMYSRLVNVGGGFSSYLEENPNYIFVVRRTFPEDYDSTDSLSDWYSEPIRIQCKEKGKVSPADAWLKIKSKINTNLPAQELRELVYKQARGCNIFNASLGTIIFKYPTTTNTIG